MTKKSSFKPLIDKDSHTLILGSLPGEKSLQMQEYYAHPYNRFWKILSALDQTSLPNTYDEKKNLVKKMHIALWDTVETANRKGSLDADIKDVTPTDINAFLLQHPQIKKVAFNGKKSEELYRRHQLPLADIEYVSLPSSSPANAAASLPDLVSTWGKLLNL